MDSRSSSSSSSNLQNTRQAFHLRRKRKDGLFRARERQNINERARLRRSNEETRTTEQQENSRRRRAARADPSVRASEQLEDTRRRRSARTDLSVRVSEQLENTRRRRSARTDLSVRVSEQLEDTRRRRTARTDLSVRVSEQLENTRRRRSARTDLSVRISEQLEDTRRRRSARTDLSVRVSEQQENTRRRRSARTDLSVRVSEQLEDTRRRQSARTDLSVRVPEQLENTRRRRSARTDLSVRVSEQLEDTRRRRSARTDLSGRVSEQLENTRRRRSVRTDLSVRVSEQQEDTRRRRSVRTDLSVRVSEQLENTRRRRSARTDLPVRVSEQLEDTRRRRSVRRNVHVREAEQERNTEQHRLRRENVSWSQALSFFQINISDGPYHKCYCCDRLFFKKSIKNLNKRNFSNEFLNSVLIDEHNTFDSVPLCTTCYSYIRKSKMPRFCIKNGLEFPNLHPSLKDLTLLEERCVAARIPFMRIFSLGVDRQLGLRGSVVNVPVEVETMVSALPRNYSNTFTCQVRLKRRIQDPNAYLYETVNPRRIFEAARYLVEQELYRENNISLDLSWIEGRNVGEENFVNNNIAELNNSEENPIVEDDNPGGEETLIDNSEGIEFAPGEGRHPLSILLDGNAEELSFPTIYGGLKRRTPQNLSYYVIANSEIRRSDRRATRTDHLLYAFKKSQIIQVTRNINVALRKKTSTHSVTAGEVRDTENLNRLIAHDDGYRVLNSLRNSPSHWENEKKNLCAMIRQIGIPTLFITLSAAEAKWTELLKILKRTVDKVELTNEDIESMTYGEKTRLIRSDATTCALYFNHRFTELLKTWRSVDGPFGRYKLRDFYYRIEFQHRGSPHVHMLVWLSDAPIFNPDSPQSFNTVQEFIDEIISCNTDIPFVDYQIHNHTSSCRRRVNGKQVCRFNIPFFPMNETLILAPLREENPAQKKLLKKNFEIVEEKLNAIPEHVLTFSEFLEYVGLSLEQYKHCIQFQLKRPKIFLARSPSEIKINAYSSKIISLFQSNMDIQFVLDPYACAVYVVDYINKANRGMSKLIRECVENSRRGNFSLRQTLRSVSNTFLNFSEVSAQEAAWMLLRLPLSKSTMGNIFIATMPPEKRVRFLKSAQELEALSDDSSEIFVEGLIEHYVQRPNSLENLTLAEFAAFYNFKKRLSSSEIEDENDLNENSENENNGHSGIRLRLRNNSGFIFKRNSPKIIRYCQYNIAQDPDNFYREMVMLYFPWRDETSELEYSLCKNVFDHNKEQILRIRENFVHPSMQISILEAIDEHEQETANDEADDEVVGAEEFAFLDVDDRMHRPDVAIDLGDMGGNTVVERFVAPKQIGEEEFFKLYQSLNLKQRDYLLHAMKRFKTNQTPIFEFISGPAGVGKSRLIECLYQSLLRAIRNERGSHEGIEVLIVAPTGKAAHNISGMTIHSAFSLPISQGMSNFNRLSSDTSHSLACKLVGLRAIIIDEISMLGSKMFYAIHKRLCQIFNRNDFFAGVSIFLFGDFNQLKPVGDRFIFQVPSDNAMLELLGPSLWENFKLYELTEIMRQRDDIAFAAALSNLAEGKLSVSEEQMFQSRCFANESCLPVEVKRAPHLFVSNKEVDEYNNFVVRNTDAPLFISNAMDIVGGTGTAQSRTHIIEVVKSKTVKDTYGLPESLPFKIGIRYMITNNLDIEDGLFNGATGILRRVDTATLTNMQVVPRRVWLKFFDEKTGYKCRQKNSSFMRSKGISSDLTPIDLLTKIIHTRKTSNLHVSRKQFPLVPAEGMTIHKSQGQTITNVVIKIGKTITRSSLYVACSRVTKLDGLYLIGSFIPPKAPGQDNLVVKELTKLRENPIIPYFQYLHEEKPFIQVIVHNTQSLLKNYKNIICDSVFKTSDILCFSETWTLDNENIDIENFTNITSVGKASLPRVAFGTSIYIRNNFSSLISFSESKCYYEGPGKHIEMSRMHFRNIQIVLIYKSPTAKISDLKSILQPFMTDGNKTIIVGDFNIDLTKSNTLEEFFRSFNFHLRNSKTESTTNARTVIDGVISNFEVEKVEVYESLYSFHKPLVALINI